MSQLGKLFALKGIICVRFLILSLWSLGPANIVNVFDTLFTRQIYNKSIKHKYKQYKDSLKYTLQEMFFLIKG